MAPTAETLCVSMLDRQEKAEATIQKVPRSDPKPSTWTSAIPGESAGGGFPGVFEQLFC